MPREQIQTEARTGIIRRLWDGWVPVWLVSLPPTPEFLGRGPDVRLRVAVIVMERSEEVRPLRCIRLDETCPPSSLTKRLLSDLDRSLGGRNEIGFSLRSGLSAGASLNVLALDPATDESRSELAEFGAAVHVGDLVESLPRVTSTRSALPLADGVEALILDGRSIRPDGTIDTSDCQISRVDPAQVLSPGDVVVRRTSPVTDGVMVAAVVPNDRSPLAAGQHVVALRSRIGAGSQTMSLLAQFLRQPFALEQMAARGHRLHIKPQRLLDITVPAPDQVLEGVLQDLDDADRQLAAWGAEVNDLRRSNFDAASPAGARARLLDQGRRLNQRVRAARQVDSLSHRVRTQYPYPVATLWRDFEAASGSLETLTRGLRLVESLTVFLGSVGAAASWGAGRPVRAYSKLTSVPEIAKGATFSQWTDVLRGIESAGPRASAETFLGGVQRLVESGAMEVVERARRLRNDLAHHRLTTSIELARSGDGVREDVELLLGYCGFLTEHALRYVDLARWDSIAHTSNLEVRDLVGDQAELPATKVETPATGVESGSLYLSSWGDRMVLLRPFVVGGVCGECNRWATSCVDSWNSGPGAPVMKALECGHLQVGTGSVDAFAALGLFQGSALGS